MNATEFIFNCLKALEWIHDEGECYLSSNVTIPESEDEAKARYENHQKFTEMSEVHEVTATILLVFQGCAVCRPVV